MSRVELKDLGRVAQQNVDAQAAAFRRTVVRTLNRAAGRAQDNLIASFKRNFRAPVPFTTNSRGYKLTLARASQAEPESKFTVKEKQSAYLQFPIEGGEREVGDAGTSKHWVFKPTRHSKLTASGSLARYFVRELIKEDGKTEVVRGGGGYWFGHIGGQPEDDRGIVKRPQRTRARFKLNTKGVQVLARPDDERLQVKDIGAPVMMVRADKTSEHKPIVDYDEAMNAGFSEAMEEMQRRLKEELER